MSGLRLTDLRVDGGGIRELLNSGEVGDWVGGLADRGADVARGRAPVESGEYRGSIRSTVATTDRKVGRIIADAPHALVVEAHHGVLNGALDG